MGRNIITGCFSRNVKKIGSYSEKVKKLIILTPVLALLLTSSNNTFAINDSLRVTFDSIKKTKQIFPVHDSASFFLKELLERDVLILMDKDDTLRSLIVRLLQHYDEPFDSIRLKLKDFPFNELPLPYKRMDHFIDTLPIWWMNGNKFIIDTIINIDDTIFDMFRRGRYTFEDITIHHVKVSEITPPVIFADSIIEIDFIYDSTAIVIEGINKVLNAKEVQELDHINGLTIVDSLDLAVRHLLRHTLERDSVLLYISGINDTPSPFWVTAGREDFVRYWVKNRQDDSITIWVGNPDHSHLTLMLEEAVRVSRPEEIKVDDIPIITTKPILKLKKLKPLEEIPRSWQYGFKSSLSLNQNHLSNWAKGGTSSFTSMIDLAGTVSYDNKKIKENWISSGRIRYGTIHTKDHGFRSNTDIFEINSQYNKVYRDKLDFSSVFYFKTQIAKGYTMPNDSVPVSKFLNPGTFTIGVGTEYKPFSHTKINFSPLSYRNTFVLDTAKILQTNHGIEAGKRSRQEFGGQLVVRNSMIILEDLKMTHAIRLFSSYLNKPQNIDVDWEMSLEKQINWYFTIKFNLHIIYDDDILFPVLDNDGEPVLWPDGTKRKAPKTQLNQFLGITLSFQL